MADFTSSPLFGDAKSYSCDWPSRYGPADDGSCGRNVAVMVLEQFDIPYEGNHPLRGNLCGYDINNMPAADVIQLSLSENMIDGKFYEVYTNPDGIAYFQQVYPNAEAADIEIRTCVPTSNIDNKADLVIVRGYDSPPCRSFKDFVSLEWLETDSLSNYVDHCAEFATEAWRAYKDPVLETSYKDGAENLYELKAFEDLLGYVIDFDGDSDPTVKYSFSDTTLKNINLFNTVGVTALRSSVEICNEDNYTLENISYNGYTYALGNFSEVDKYGNPWPLFLNVQGLYAVVYNVISATLYPNSPAYGANGGAHVIVDPKKKFISIPASNWHWTLDSDGSPDIHFYHRTPLDIESNSWASSVPLVSWAWSDETGLADSSPRSPGSAPPGLIMPNLGGGWVSMIMKLWAAVELDRPSVHVDDPAGRAIQLVNALDVRYQPIVVTDEPSPVAYTFGGGVSLVDHTLDLYDSDPSTVQDAPATLTGSLAWLQTQTTGRTVDISLPFCDEDGCKEMARTIFDLQDENISTYNMVCGPAKIPKLGTRVPGYEGRVNKISFSYTDSSSYNINITVGPTFLGAKGWGGGIYQRATESTSRSGIITHSFGDGVNYRVKIQGGLGVYNAINKTLSAWNPGEKVSVTIHNNPVEK